jgi:diguanylate cyclase (GGDEF)-like protein
LGREADRRRRESPVDTRLVAALRAHSADPTDDAALRAVATEWAAEHSVATDVVHELARIRASIRRTLRGPGARERLDAGLYVVAVEAVQAVSERLVRDALTDPLTGLPTRRAFGTDLHRGIAGAVRTGRPLSVVVLDLDGLKQVNDTGGHAAGDRRLVALADTLRSVLRDSDGIYRIGGDEFGLLLPDTTAAAAATAMTRLVAAGAPAVSWGCAEVPLETDDADAVLALADERMYGDRRQRRGGTTRVARARRRLPRGRNWPPLLVACALVVTLAVGLPHWLDGSAPPLRPTASRPVVAGHRPLPVPVHSPPATARRPANRPPQGATTAPIQVAALHQVRPASRTSAAAHRAGARRPTVRPHPVVPAPPSPLSQLLGLVHGVLCGVLGCQP